MEKGDEIGVVRLDPETEFLYSKQATTGNEWELFKENVKPIKRGRNVTLLNQALKSHSDSQLKKSLLHTRRRLIEAIDEYKGDDPLHPWLEAFEYSPAPVVADELFYLSSDIFTLSCSFRERKICGNLCRCIKWVQEAFPPGGDCSGLVVIYEQCVRTFWHEDRYKNDLRYLKVWLEYAENCADAEVIYNFLEANKIGQAHSIFFISYALHMESKNKIRTANEVFNRGMSRRIPKRIAHLSEALELYWLGEKAVGSSFVEVFPYVILPPEISPAEVFPVVAGTQTTESSDFPRKKLKQDRAHGTPLAIYKDTKADVSLVYQPELSKTDTKSWNVLGARAERNKENNAIPTKWTSNKIPRRAVPRTGGATASACIEIFVDEECAENNKSGSDSGKSSTLQLRDEEGHELKKKTELLRENPLRNFPPDCLPR
ncbi:hypothetical protein RHGRI_015720 [Rhododendron griersonianum]|uniref:BUB1 N-terminal domain-containing protein n=1 Tax=Rhododendron griersonianum TaxID=479676 RepID=A0AAV6JRG3_9ERIC|nr:hypothetical protein RHGRI_015720 [Rhododendron griersonianum]